jgi:hypothetical protein
MKVALCFIINYDHVLNKEHIWREWIKPNIDIINIYFFYESLEKIKSEWILAHVLPKEYIFKTTYVNVIPAYLSLMLFASKDDNENQWFCFLTDSCCPIVSPERFRSMFEKHSNLSIMSWKPAWWNVTFHKRANLALLPEYLRLANDPWFILNKVDCLHCLWFSKQKKELVKLICDGGIANESIFAIILAAAGTLNRIKSEVTHMTDWSRMTSSTSPHVFKLSTVDADIKFIENELKNRNFKFFIRKVATDFPDEVLRYYIYNKFPVEDVQKKKSFRFLDFFLLCLLIGFSYFAFFGSRPF